MADDLFSRINRNCGYGKR